MISFICVPPETFDRGLYTKNTPPQGGEYQPMSFAGKNMKRGRENGGKCNRKRGKM
jgi:hypothetical protein